MKQLRSIPGLLALLLVVSCSTMTAIEMEKRFGPAEPRDHVVDTIPVGAVDYWQDVKPIVEQRCVVCHACYDAPCQLKMGSIEGIERGANATKVYDATRIKAAPMSRLFQDAQSVAEWRNMGFSPILNEYENTPQANRDGSVMHRILRLKEENPLPDGKQLPNSFDLSLDRKQFCAKPETLDKFEKKHPLWGMPYAFPGLDNKEQSTLLAWLEAGAEYTARPPLSPEFAAEIETWEAFLNGDSLKSRLSSRYIFEHLFLGNLYFPEISENQFFSIVRSATPPGEPVKLIATRRPYNDPGVDRSYYRIVPVVGAIVDKTHMPYALDAARMARWQEIFIDTDYSVSALPSYDEKTSSNPFMTFHALPVESRYRFMLDEAQFTIMSFIKGPVCRGQAALNVINDNFWVFFIDPNFTSTGIIDDFLSGREQQLSLPASTENIYRPIKHWKQYAAQEKKLIADTDDYLTANLKDKFVIDLDLIWDGNGTNDNAALTVLRHFDSATVVKGLVGSPPKTAWVIGYTLLERIHYLLVAGYDVYGNVGHQLLSRVYMDFLRMDGEKNFLLLLPEEARIRERNYWYRDAEKEVNEFMTLPRFENEFQTSINYQTQTDNQKLELYGLLHERLKAVLSDQHTKFSISSSAALESLARINGLVGPAPNLMPQLSFVEIASPSGNYYVTLVRNNAHLNMTSIFGEKKFREPDKDTLMVVPGLLGAHPNMFILVNESGLDQFADQVTAMRTEGDYAQLLDDYGIRRTNADFWRHSDTFHTAARELHGVEFGLLDYSRFENR